MKKDDIINLSLHIITEYYKNDLEPFFSYVSDDVISQPEIVCLHISNAWPYDNRDTIYPVHYEHIFAAMRAPTEAERYVFAKALDGSVYRLALSRILYIATIKHAARLRVHTESGEIVITGTLSDFVRKYPDFFLRIHSGYLINPAHVIKIRRFAVTMSDGAELPVPEKKYTRIKKLLLPEKGSAAPQIPSQIK